MHTYVFNVVPLDNLEKLEDVCEDITKTVSCILLPFRVYDEEDENSFEVMYYMHTEDHRELSDKGIEFVFPQPYFMKDDDYHKMKNGITGNGTDINFKDRKVCESFIGKEVHPTEEFACGKVTKFKYIRNERTKAGAMWTVSFYKEMNYEGGSAAKNIGVQYDELLQILIQEQASIQGCEENEEDVEEENYEATFYI